MVRTMSCIICTCLTGSGTLLTEQDTASFTAVSRDTLWPTDTYTGLAASCDVRTACVGEKTGRFVVDESYTPQLLSASGPSNQVVPQTVCATPCWSCAVPAAGG